MRSPGEGIGRGWAALAVLLVADLLSGCASVDVTIRQGPPRRIGSEAVALADPVFLADLVEPASDEAIFEAGYTIGHLHMSGGYVVVKTERGMQVRSKNIAFHEQARYRKLAAAWALRTFRAALSWKRRSVIEIGALARAAIAAPERRELRGSARLDLRDNQNLPRFDLVPRRLEEAMRAALPDLGGAAYLLVPFVVVYYTHNGGWFVGQTYGTGGGARIRLLWILYDTLDGSVVRWGEIAGRYVEKYVFSPNSSQIDDYLLAVEEALSRKIRRRLLR